MDFGFTEEQQYVKDVARKFADERLFPHAGEFDKNAKLDRGVIKEMAELGLMGVQVPEKYGGTGLDELAYAISLEELARGCSSHALVEALHGSRFTFPLLDYGTEAQITKYTPPVCSGEQLSRYS